jgi:hypothetical protein
MYNSRNVITKMTFFFSFFFSGWVTAHGFGHCASTLISRSILPTTRSYWHHSNRLDVAHRLVQQPPSHCHPPPRATHPGARLHHAMTTHCHFFHSAFNRSYLAQYCHPHAQTTTIRTVLISRIDSYHNHQTTATPHATTHPGARLHHAMTTRSNFPLFFHPAFEQPYLAQYCHPHAQTTTIRTALISRIDWYHNHCATATPHPVPPTPAPACTTP